jgi:ribosomal protein S18 acetylase RimI-like enzyme
MTQEPTSTAAFTDHIARITGRAPSIRIAAPSDAPAISNLLYEFNGEALPPAELAERMVQARGLETVFLGELAGTLAGLLVLRTAPTLSGPDDWAEITELYVRPGFRRRGVGRALVQAAIEHGHSSGCLELHLLVDPENTGALSLYRAMGFHLDAWEMRLEL